MDALLKRSLEELPEKLELTEHQWYEYHYQLKRNLFLIERLQNIYPRPGKIIVIERENSYLMEAFHAAGFKTERLTELAGSNLDNYDLILLLNILEFQQEHPEKILSDLLSKVNANGRIMLISENRLQIKNRILALLGHQPFQYNAENGLTIFYRQYSMNELLTVVKRLHTGSIEHQFISPYPPYRIEPLSLFRYLLKYFNYFVMKILPRQRNLLYLVVQKG